SAGSSMAARMAIIAMTTSSSIRVKAGGAPARSCLRPMPALPLRLLVRSNIARLDLPGPGAAPAGGRHVTTAPDRSGAQSCRHEMRSGLLLQPEKALLSADGIGDKVLVAYVQ